LTESYFYAIAEGEIKPRQFVRPGKKEGTVTALGPDEPVIIDGKPNPKIVGRVPTWENLEPDSKLYKRKKGEVVKVHLFEF